MPKKQSMFSIDAAARAQEQTTIESSLKGMKKSNRKVAMNISLSQDYKDRLIAYASSKGLSASVIVQMWIDEHCN